MATITTDHKRKHLAFSNAFLRDAIIEKAQREGADIALPTGGEPGDAVALRIGAEDNPGAVWVPMEEGLDVEANLLVIIDSNLA